MARNDTEELLTLYPHQMKMAGFFKNLFGGGKAKAVDAASDAAKAVSAETKGIRAALGASDAAPEMLSDANDVFGGMKKVLRPAPEPGKLTDFVERGYKNPRAPKPKPAAGPRPIGESISEAVDALEAERLAEGAGSGGSSWIAPALLGVGGGVAAGGIGGGLIGSKIQKDRSDQDAKRRALMAFGGGLAAGVAAPTFVQSATQMMGQALPYANAMTSYPGQKYSSFYGVKSLQTPYLDAYVKEANVFRRVASGAGDLMTRGGKALDNTMMGFLGGAKNAPVSADLRRAAEHIPTGSGSRIGGRALDTVPKTKAPAPAPQAKAPAPQAKAPAPQAKAPAPQGNDLGAAIDGKSGVPASGGDASKLQGMKGGDGQRGTKGKRGKKGKPATDQIPASEAAPDAGQPLSFDNIGHTGAAAEGAADVAGAAPGASAGAWDRATEFAKNNPWKTGVGISAPLAVGGAMGTGGYMAGQHEAENRPLLQRVMGSDKPIMEQLSSGLGQIF